MSNAQSTSPVSRTMRVDVYERWWLWIASSLILGFLAIIVASSVLHAVHPPSHVETIDPATARTESEFASPGVFPQPDGSTLVVMVAAMFTFDPETVVVPVGEPVRFRITSPDVIHGFQIAGTNANVTVIPGYVSEFEVTFPRAGEYLVLCNEFCGLSHHMMQGRFIARSAREEDP